MVRVKKSGKQKTLGHFANIFEAARQYDHYLIHNKVDLLLNFDPITHDRLTGKLSAKDFWSSLGFGV
jgi:hypothetical protein